MYKLEPLILQLVNPFGTNHSVTITRTNAYLEIKYLDVVGIGEAGLPPKKENCYFTDYHDIEQFFTIFCNTAPLENYNAFQTFENTEYFQTQNGPALQFLNQQLSRLDQIPNDNINLASKALFECALIDWYCKYNQQPVAQFIGLENYQNLQIPKMRNFFTLSLLDDVNEVLKQLEVGFPFTPNLKIKVGSNLDYVKEVLLRLYTTTIQKLPNYPGLLSIDCNSSWTPEIALQFLQLMDHELKELRPYLYMIEQPFPLIFEKEQWYIVKQKYVEYGIEIFADESIKTYKDVENLQQVVSGVNIKLEKSSGYRGAVQNFIKATELKLNKWVGIMIGSSLVANQAINLLGLASVGGDIDGTLLVKDHRVKQQFIWFDQTTQYWGMIQL